MIYIYEELGLRTRVRNNDELKKVLYSITSDFDLRSSNFDWHGSYLIDDWGQKIGKVSYNSRVWNVNNEDEELFFEDDIVTRTEIVE
jgi:hypothetical protein